MLLIDDFSPSTDPWDGGRGSRGMFQLRPYSARDSRKVWRLLTILPKLYPNGSEWLDRRLNDVLTNKARCTVAVSDDAIVGITIESFKGLRTVKLSTIFVRRGSRRMGVGQALLNRCRSHWLSAGVDRAYVTADLHSSSPLDSLLLRYGFHLHCIEANRYGEGRNEAVFGWFPQSISHT